MRPNVARMIPYPMLAVGTSKMQISSPKILWLKNITSLKPCVTKPANYKGKQWHRFEDPRANLTIPVLLSWSQHMLRSFSSHGQSCYTKRKKDL